MLHYSVLFFRYVLECPSCGIIYRSRQYWYGNLDPEQKVVRTEIRHVWKGVSNVSGVGNRGRGVGAAVSNMNGGQICLISDIKYITDAFP